MTTTPDEPQIQRVPPEGASTNQLRWLVLAWQDAPLPLETLTGQHPGTADAAAWGTAAATRLAAQLSAEVVGVPLLRADVIGRDLLVATEANVR